MQGGLNLLYVGRLDPEKGVATIINALRGFPAAKKVHLRILGTGSQKQQLQAMARKVTTAQIDFEGQASITDVQAAMQWSHVVLVPSLVTERWMEQWGRVPIEAILSGRLCLVSNSGELPHLSPIPGTVFAPGDSDDLRRVVMDLTASQEQMQSVISQQYANAQRFDALTLATQVDELWSAALAVRVPSKYPSD